MDMRPHGDLRSTRISDNIVANDVRTSDDVLSIRAASERLDLASQFERTRHRKISLNLTTLIDQETVDLDASLSMTIVLLFLSAIFMPSLVNVTYCSAHR